MRFSFASRLSAAVIPALLLATGAASADASNDRLLSEDELKSAIRAYVQDHPDEILESIDRYLTAMEELQQEEAAAASQAKLERKLDELLSADGLPVSGNPSGAVTVTYFADYNCPYCKAMEPVVHEILEANDDLRVIYRDFPILGESSEQAAAMALALWDTQPEAFGALHEAIYAQSGKLSETALQTILGDVIGDAEAAAVIEQLDDAEVTEIIAARIDANMALASELDITGTPYFFVHGTSGFTSVPGAADVDTIQNAIDGVR